MPAAPRLPSLLLLLLLFSSFSCSSYAFLPLLPSLPSSTRTAITSTSTSRTTPLKLSPASSSPSSSSSQQPSLTPSQVEEKLANVWDKNVPSSLGEIINQAQASLCAALEAGETRLRVDIQTPGLCEQFEQTAIREKGLLLGVLDNFFPLFANKRTKVLFESEGEAAMAAKAFTSFDVPETVTFTGLTTRAVAEEDEVLFIVEPVNRPGSPVILTIEELLEKYPSKTFILFNPDLEMKGSTIGIRERDRRQGFLDSFKSAFIYLALASLSRPALIPRELGALHYQYEQGVYRLLRCLLPEDGPGSLNRFLKRPIYEKSPLTPTATNPPNFYQVAEYSSRPQAEELSMAMQRSEAVLEDLIRNVSESIDTVEEARDVLVEASKTRGVDPGKVLSAIDFLEKNSRKGKKDPNEEQKQAEELRRKIAGEWRLIFTTGTKNTQTKMGKINYFPVKAFQSFAKDSDAYSNNICLGDWKVVQVLGTFSCPKFKKLEFKVESIKLGPLGFGSKGEGFFTFFYVDESIAVARGQGGGLALWSKQADY